MAGIDRPTRAVRAVVRAVAPAYGPGPRSVEEVVASYAQYRGRPIEVWRRPLAVGVFGMWVHSDARDVLIVSTSIATFDQTLAHEFGHLVLGHPQGCSVDPDSITSRRCEREAETFGNQLVRAVRSGRTAGHVDAVVDELLG